MNSEEFEIVRRFENGETVLIHKGRHGRIMKHYKGQGILKPICRPSKLGNPHSFDKSNDDERAEAIEKYLQHIDEHPELLPEIEKLRGKILMCYCNPKPCHGDVLLEILNKTAG